jgi:excinuclease ABC subunit C
MSIIKPSKNLIKQINAAPKNPGCYLFKTENGEILYVGKAKNILNRVKSYITGFKNLDTRKQNMILAAHSVEFIIVDSETEAYILESNLIKKYKTKYNVLLRDDKNYSWILIEKKVSNSNDFPRIRIIRETSKANYQGELFGPFPSQLPLKNILKRLRRIFPYASCNRKIQVESLDPLTIKTSDSKPCLYYHIGLCKAPCATLVTPDQYNNSILNIKKFFQGRKNEIILEYEKNMKLAAKNLNFEQASIWKQKIEEIKFVTAHIKINSEVDDINIAQLQRDERHNALNDLIEKLKFPKNALKLHEDFRIECFDISNIQGTNPVGAMTVMIDGELRPDMYRRFKITTKKTPDDFAMMQEMIERRLKHIHNSEDVSLSRLPDLIVIDGGKGQLSSVFKILKMTQFDNIPIIGLAKRDEEIFKLREQFNTNYSMIDPVYDRIYLSRKSQSLFLIQRIRDEAHRFGITFHRKLRSTQMLIDQINDYQI